MAVTLIPFMLIPQMILAGLLVPVTGFLKLSSTLFNPLYAAHEGAQGQLSDTAQQLLRLSPLPMWMASGLLLFHGLIAVLLGLAFLYKRDRQNMTYTELLREAPALLEKLRAKLPHLPKT